MAAPTRKSFSPVNGKFSPLERFRFVWIEQGPPKLLSVDAKQRFVAKLCRLIVRKSHRDRVERYVLKLLKSNESHKFSVSNVSILVYVIITVSV